MYSRRRLSSESPGLGRTRTSNERLREVQAPAGGSHRSEPLQQPHHRGTNRRLEQLVRIGDRVRDVDEDAHRSLAVRRLQQVGDPVGDAVGDGLNRFAQLGASFSEQMAIVRSSFTWKAQPPLVVTSGFWSAETIGSAAELVDQRRHLFRTFRRITALTCGGSTLETTLIPISISSI